VADLRAWGRSTEVPTPCQVDTLSCEGAPAWGRVNLGERSAPQRAGQVSRGGDPTMRPDLTRATVLATDPASLEKPSDLAQHVGCSFLPRGGGDKVRMSQEVIVAAASVRTGKPLAGVGLSPHLRMNLLT
jgi:hypothetical protein